MFSLLQIWEDDAVRSPSAQMAMDEALLLLSSHPVLRTYRWAAPAVTFGYAQRHADVGSLAGSLPAVRRWTGGGTVFHGSDLTLTLAVPAPHPLCSECPAMIYREIHQALLIVLREDAPAVRLADVEDCRPGPACFDSPALHDILLGGKKICGGALRRGKSGILYQGSLHGEVPAPALARALTKSSAPFVPGPPLELASSRLDLEKYATEGWNRMR
ncbi:MAG: hypothetical protein WCQ16_06280 [Verrucomicrobiae bacterium]